MTSDVAMNIKATFYDFKEQGLSKIQLGVIILKKQKFEDVVVSLNEVESLMEVAPLDILKGCPVFSFDDFKKKNQFQEA